MEGNMRICAAGVGRKDLTHELAQTLADMGFDYSDLWGLAGGAVDEQAAAAHSVGIRLIARWPDWGEMGLCDEAHAFQAHDGRTNIRQAQPDGSYLPWPQLLGPSLWHPEAEERAAEVIPRLAASGVDGVVIGTLDSDGPIPTNYHGMEAKLAEGTTLFWSFDEFAQAEWSEAGGGAPMPQRATGCDGGLPDELAKFYRWYQDSWINRIIRLSDMALDVGLTEIYTWWVPLVWYADSHVATATADNQLALARWREHVLGRGGHPVTILAKLYPDPGESLPWGARAEAEIQQILAESPDWDCIVGAQAEVGEGCVDNVRTNGTKAAAAGYTGIFASYRHLAAQPAEATSAIQSVRSLPCRQ